MLGRILTLFVLTLFFASSGAVSHAHEGPERIVEGKYAIFLSIIPAGSNSFNLRFSFNDAQTGKSVSDIFPVVSIVDAGGAIVLGSTRIEVKDGTAEMPYAFPSSGLFEVFMEFNHVAEPGKIYRPEGWEIWVPGEDGAEAPYQFGLAEASGFILAGIAAVLVIWSFISNRKKK